MASFIYLGCSGPLAMLGNGSWWKDEGVRYRAATLAFNYVDLGAVRRGLGGTLLTLAGVEPIFGLVVFHFVCVLFAAAVLCIAIGEHATRPVFCGLSAIGAAALFAFWGGDAGRTDVVIAGLLGTATLQVRRPLFAAACLVVALGFHEMGVLFGVPLLMALWLDRRWTGQPSVAPARGADRSWRAAVALLVVAAGSQLLVERLPHASVGATARWFWERMPHSEFAEWALYFYVAGSRGIQVAVCQNLTLDPYYPLHVASGLAVIVATVVVFDGGQRRGWRAPLLAAVVPFVVLSAIAVDLARWSAFAALNAWFVFAARPAAAPDIGGRRTLLLRGLLLCGVVSAASPRQDVYTGPAIFSPAPLVDRIAWELMEPRTSPSTGTALRTCDPRWRDLLVPRDR